MAKRQEIDQLIDDAVSRFEEVFQRKATVVSCAPGRVNLIGEHIDYNDGFVLPMAVERYVVIAGAPTDENQNYATVYSHNLKDSVTIQLQGSLLASSFHWSDYLNGVVSGFKDRGIAIPGFDAFIASSIPMGGGLSSSAALEVATATLIEHLSNTKLDLRDKALLCQTAEHRFANVPCGIMDQFSSVFGKQNELMLIDCSNHEIKSVPFDSRDVSVLITNSNVKHELGGTEYSTRRSECEEALKKLGRESWRDITTGFLLRRRELLSEVEFRRATHVVTETERTLKMAEAIRNRDWDYTGNIMYASHHSLQNDYQVSCPELDTLVEIANEIGREGGVYGSRMTGGGFGGSTVSLVKSSQLTTVMNSLITEYESRTGRLATCFASRPAQGAHSFTVPGNKDRTLYAGS